jgi:hypothetical protein
MSAAATTALPIDLPEMIAEARSELNRRRQVYGFQVRQGYLNARQAARQIDRMQAILDLLIELNGSPDTLTEHRAA